MTNPFLPRFITEKDYFQLHESNRICFDFIAQYDEEYYHFRLLDGDRDDQTSYILIEFLDENSKIYTQITLEQAFNILALHNAYILYPHPGHEKIHETYFIEAVYSLLEQAGRGGDDEV